MIENIWYYLRVAYWLNRLCGIPVFAFRGDTCWSYALTFMDDFWREPDGSFSMEPIDAVREELSCCH